MKVLIKNGVLREEQIFSRNLNKLVGIGRLIDFLGMLKSIAFSKSHENALKFQYGLYVNMVLDTGMILLKQRFLPPTNPSELLPYVSQRAQDN